MNKDEKQTDLEKRQEALVARAAENRKIIMGLVAEGKLPEPRALTRGERKKVDERGLNIFKVKPEDKRSIAAVQDELHDLILDMLYPSFDFDGLPNNVVTWFGDYVFSITYRDDLSEKN